MRERHTTHWCKDDVSNCISRPPEQSPLSTLPMSMWRSSPTTMPGRRSRRKQQSGWNAPRTGRSPYMLLKLPLSTIGRHARGRRRLDETSIALARIDQKVGDALVILSRSDDAIPVLERSIDGYRKAQDLDGASRAAASLTHALVSGGAAQEGLRRVESLVGLLAAGGPSSALASLHLARNHAFQTLGRYEEMLAEAERAAEIATATGDERLLARATERRATALVALGRVDEAKAVQGEAIRLLERVGELLWLVFAYANLGEAHRLRGELEEARISTNAVSRRRSESAIPRTSLSG